MEKGKNFIAIGDMVFSLRVSLLMQTLMYAYRPECLFKVSGYVFDQWFHKESIPKKKRAKQSNKRKRTSNVSEDNTEEAQPETGAVEDQTEDTSAHMHIAQSNVNREPSLLTTGDLHLEDQTASQNQLPQDKTMISRQDIRELMSLDGRATYINFQESHPQYATHRLALNVTRRIPVLNGVRTRGVETVRKLLKSAEHAALASTIAQESDEPQTTPSALPPGKAERAQADEYALQLLALHKPWNGDGKNILDLEVLNDFADDGTTRIIRMESYSECLLKWYDAEGSTAIPLHTRRILDHYQNYYDLKKIASDMAHARRKQQRQTLGLPPTNESARQMYEGAMNDGHEIFEEDENNTEGASTAPVITPGEPRRFDDVTRTMLNNLHIGMYLHTYLHDNKPV